MDKGHIGLVSACVVAAIVAAHALVASRAWERRVHAAEVVVDSLEHVAADTEVVVAHTDTVRVTLTKLIQQTDSTSHPDSTCTRSLAARDTVIATSALEIQSLQSVTRLQMLALTTLRATLDARPKAGVTLELLHQSLHLSLQAMVYPQARVGIGVSYDLARIRL